jgi:hypothetical protein
MLLRSLGRWVGVLVIGWTTAGAVASCGSSGNNSQFVPGGQDASTTGDDATSGGGDTGSFIGDASGEGGGNGNCTPKTCAGLGYSCGPNSDGCGNLLNCGTCQLPQYCGGGGFSKCGGSTETQPDGASVCTPTTCQALGYSCGTAGDGCGGSLDCGTCNSPQFCGGGGFSQCGGNNGLQADGGNPCTPQTCTSLGYDCGPAGDGCGNLLQCGSCTSPQYCGGGGPDKCGGSTGVGSDGGVICTPTTCTALGYDCGVAGDGCGNALQCGTCSSPQYCGGGGYDTCGGTNGLQPDGAPACTPETCNSLGYTCGTVGNGCGGTLTCGTCTSPQYCGGGGFNKCGGDNGLGPDGGATCTPTTCAKLGYSCGPAGDGCGGLLQCGTCTSPQYCGGGGYDVCGPPTIAACDAGATSLTGYVFDPANNLPIYNALVYVPVNAVVTPQTGVLPVSCGCSAPPAYASAFTGIDGKFTLNSPPSGTAVTVVVQLGKWQRVFSEPITACQPNTITTGNLTLPSTHLEGNIPLFAVDTGGVDSMECVLLKMGIAQSEFVDPTIVGGVPTNAGRIHMYEGSIVAGGAIIDVNTPKEAALTETATVLDSYDVVLFPCQGGAGDYDKANGFPNTLSNLINYTTDGGRMFATHYHYDLLETNGSFANTATWVNGTSWGNYYGDPKYNSIIDQTFATGVVLADWLNQPIVYGGTFGQIPVGVIRNNFSAVNAPAQRWIYTANDSASGGPPANVPIHYTFDTPFVKGGAAGTCGRVVYSDFHVESQPNGTDFTGEVFPAECQGTTPASMTPQEKLLEFMLFDLTSCVSPPTCTPLTCASFPAGTCGVQGDGCGGQTADCGTCTAPQTCGGGGVPGTCGYPDAGACTPQTCAQQHINCGPAGDGCGNELMCGPCTLPQTCGGGGTPGQCGYPDGGSCNPETCAQQNINCGPTGDGCGNELMCGTCTPPQTCGGGGAAGQCGYPDGGACTPLSCSVQNITCGPAGDGCGNELMCGTCTPPQTCGGGGVPGQCGAPDAGSCMPTSCAQQNIDCGPAGDGCGNELMCGVCTSPQSCGGGGVPGQCGLLDGGDCMPITCQAQNITCGPAGDGCGNLLQCGSCTSPQTCGGGGVAGQCGGGAMSQ